MAMHSSDSIKAELVDYFIDDEKSYVFDQKDRKFDASRSRLDDTGLPAAGNESQFVHAAITTGNPPVQPAPILPPVGLPVQAYPNYQNYVFWFRLDSAALDKEILLRNTLCIEYARNRTVCAVLGLLMFFHLLLFHGHAVRWISTVLKTTPGVHLLPPGILWFAGNIVTLAALAVVCRYVWALLRQMFRIQQVLPLVLPNDVLFELELKDPTFHRLFVPEESLRPSYFAETPRINDDTNMFPQDPLMQSDRVPGSLFRTATPPAAANESFFSNLSARRTPDISLTRRGPAVSSSPPLLLPNRGAWKAPETPFSWLHMPHSSPKPQTVQQNAPLLPRFMEDDYTVRQRHEQASELNNSAYLAWLQQQQQSMFYNNSPSFNINSPYYADDPNSASLLYPSPMSLRSGARAPSPAPSNDAGDTSMLSTSSSASKRSRTPSCLLHEHDKFDSVDRENVYNTYGYPAVERAFDSLKEVSNISPHVFYSSQFLARLLAASHGYNAADQFDVPQTLNTTVQPFMQNAAASPFGFLRHRRKQQSPGRLHIKDAMETSPPNLPLDGLSLSPEEVWTLLGVTPSQLYAYTQNLKHWLLITVVRPLDALVDECDQVLTTATTTGQEEAYRFAKNPISALHNVFMGRTNAAVGGSVRMNSNIAFLRQALRAKPDECRMLNNLIPFLEAFSTLRPQNNTVAASESIKYALQRINLLSNAPGIMNNYSWDGSNAPTAALDSSMHHLMLLQQQQQQTYAGIFNATPPTPGLWGMQKFNAPIVAGDALLLYDTFRTFFDIIMAADPRSVAGSFSYHYVLPPTVAVDQTLTASRLPFPMLYQESGAGGSGGGAMITPPNFQVFYEGKFLQPERGRNNLFHAILLFLILLRNRFEDGRGAVWLGSAGSHIFDVFRSDYREFMESILIEG